MKRAILLSLLLTGCVTSSAQMLDDRTEMISASGGGRGGMPKVVRRIMLEAAQKAQERGYDYFQIVSSNDASSTGTMVLPGTSTTNLSGYCSGSWCSGTATTTGGGGLVMPFVRPGANVMVHFYRRGEIDPASPGLFNVASVLAQK